MYFWKINELKSDLREKPLPESESFKYMFIFFVLYSIATIPFFENNIWDVYYYVIGVFIEAIGIYYVYKCNNGSSGNNFLQKYLSIGWVMVIRWFVLVVLPMMIIYFTVVEIYFGIPEHTTPSDVIFYSMLIVLYFWLVGKHVKDLANQPHPVVPSF